MIYDKQMFTPEVVQSRSVIEDFATIGGAGLKVFAKSANFGKRGDLIYLSYFISSFFIMFTHTITAILKLLGF